MPCLAGSETLCVISTDVGQTIRLTSCILLWVCLLIATLIHGCSGAEKNKEGGVQHLMKECDDTSLMIQKAKRGGVERSGESAHTTDTDKSWSDGLLAVVPETDSVRHRSACKVHMTDAVLLGDDDMYLARLKLAGLTASMEDLQQFRQDGDPSVCVQINGEDMADRRDDIKKDVSGKPRPGRTRRLHARRAENLSHGRSLGESRSG
mmetsp:Transcript_4/g.14  ORF Transcript_4/g.14 Transcript_4/m.14 type:complete len:207 (-) Transcript_4:236-856(-)